MPTSSAGEGFQGRRHTTRPDSGDPTSDEAFPVVALVGSSGGLAAVSQIIGTLPAGLPAAIVVLIHTDPKAISRIDAILGRASALPVRMATDGSPLTAGSIVAVPPGTHLLITPGARTALIVSGEYPPSRPSADLLLATLATALGERAVAVILSGGGHDGATGATAVHVCGGTVLATDETSSSSYSMPLAAIKRDGSVDRTLPLGDIAGAICDLVAARTAVNYES